MQDEYVEFRAAYVAKRDFYIFPLNKHFKTSASSSAATSFERASCSFLLSSTMRKMKCSKVSITSRQEI